MNKAIFSDLDGTLIHTKSGKTFPENKDDWRLDYTVLDAIYGYMTKTLSGTLCIVTNQGGVAAGYVKKSDFLEKLDDIKSTIENYFLNNYSYNIKIDAGISFTIDPTDFMRKPNPGLGYHLALRNNLILTQCIMIGDNEDDKSNTDEGFASNCVMNFFDVESFVMFYNPSDVYKKPI